MRLDDPCPDDARLLAFSRGELGAEAAETVCRHLAGCPRCEALLASLEAQGDGLVATLRGLAGRGAPHRGRFFLDR